MQQVKKKLLEDYAFRQEYDVQLGTGGNPHHA